MAALQRLTDPRCRRGVRHRFPAVLALTFRGLPRRPTDRAALARWATTHSDPLRPARGLTRRCAPPTPLTRGTARYGLAQRHDARCRWRAGEPPGPPRPAAAVGGKPSPRGRAADGAPPHGLDAFAHDARRRGAGERRARW